MAGAEAEREFFGDCAGGDDEDQYQIASCRHELQAWITTILRNPYFNVYRHIAKVAEDAMAPAAP
jgi:hypothetical protein